MNSGKASMLEHLIARNNIHLFLFLVRRRADLRLQYSDYQNRELKSTSFRLGIIRQDLVSDVSCAIRFRVHSHAPAPVPSTPRTEHRRSEVQSAVLRS